MLRKSLVWPSQGHYTWPRFYKRLSSQHSHKINQKGIPIDTYKYDISIDILNGKIQMDEVEKALIKIKKGKASGIDGILIECYSSDIKYFTPLLYCAVLYCTVLCCTVLYCTVLYCTVLYCTVLYCTVLYCTVPYRTVPYRTVPYRTVPYRTVPYRTVPYRTVLYCTVLYVIPFLIQQITQKTGRRGWSTQFIKKAINQMHKTTEKFLWFPLLLKFLNLY